jgi:hypothetical protein
MIDLDTVVKTVEDVVDWVDSKPSVPMALAGFGIGVMLPMSVLIYGAVACGLGYAALRYLKKGD